MEHVGIDLGKIHSHIAIVSERGEISNHRVATYGLPGWLQGRPRSRVVMEACTQSGAVARAALAANHETVVVPGAFVRLIGVGARGIKTDVRDAEALANASLRNAVLPSSHLRSESSLYRHELTTARDALLSARKGLSLRVKAWLRGHLVSVKGRAKTTEFVTAVRRVAAEEKLQISLAMEVLLASYVQLCAQIEILDAEIEREVERDPVCQQLMQMPGVGPQIVLAFTAQVDDPNRFPTSDHLASYLALVPGEATTGGKVVRCGTIKAGPAHLKSLLIQGAWSMWRARPNDPIVVWARAIADKRGKRIAVMALARKTATILWSMWKHGGPYNPALASSARAAPVSPPPSTPLAPSKQRQASVVVDESTTTTQAAPDSKGKKRTRTRSSAA